MSDPGSPQPLELGAHAGPVVTRGQEVGQHQGILQRHCRPLRPHRPGGVGGVADQDQPTATPTLATDLLHRRVVQPARVVQQRSHRDAHGLGEAGEGRTKPLRVVAGGTASTTALTGSTEEEQFDAPQSPITGLPGSTEDEQFVR